MLNRSHSRIIVILLGCCLVATAGSAQKVKVEANRDMKADFTTLRTYTWLPSPPTKRDTAPDAVTDPRISQKALGTHIVGAVDRELSARGLTRIEQGESDVQVIYYAALTTGVNTADAGSYYQYTTGWALPPVPLATTNFEIVQRGTIIVDVVNPTSKTAIWRGTVESNVNSENQPEKRIARINEAIARVFERFPLRPVKKR
jgi:Domain of unknown function (DUF4136)